MKDQFAQFKSLHESAEPLLIANVWNAQSARIFEKLGYKAMATSSAAVAETLGYSDGEQMSFDEYRFVIRHITQATTLPISVDLEAGYGESSEHVVNNIRQLVSDGVAGINIEDSVIHNGNRTLVDARSFTVRLQKIVDGLKQASTNIFINVRCDAFLLGVPTPVEEAKNRLTLYSATGVHGLFFPCITALEDIRSVVQATQLPVNVMCMPQLPRFTELKQAGVKRISMGNFVNKHVYTELEKVGQRFLEEGNFSSLF
jgi:2-methylisocitrate lyase-like PEP mutase family enzyme